MGEEPKAKPEWTAVHVGAGSRVAGSETPGPPNQRHSSTAKFFLYTGAVFFFFLLNGLAVERLLKGVEGFYRFGWFLTLFQFCVYVALSWLRLRGWGPRAGPRKAFSQTPTRTLASIAFFTVATSGLSNASIGYMNYPTQLMFKSCKVIPVMVAGMFIQGKRYSLLEWSSMLLMTVGLVFFSLADQALSPNFQAQGIVMVCSALCADAVIGNLQEKAMRQYHLSNDELIFRCYSIGVGYILLILLGKAELWDALVFCGERWAEVLHLMLAFAVSSFFGLHAVLLLIKNFGAVTTVTVTTCRKALTICLSFLLFAKPFGFQYVWSGGLVLLGIYVNFCAKKGLPVLPAALLHGPLGLLSRLFARPQAPKHAPLIPV